MKSTYPARSKKSLPLAGIAGLFAGTVLGLTGGFLLGERSTLGLQSLTSSSIAPTLLPAISPEAHCPARMTTVELDAQDFGL